MALRQGDRSATYFINGGGVLLNRSQSTAVVSRVFQWYSPDFGGKWMGSGNRAAILGYIAPFLESGDCEFVSTQPKGIRVRYQQYDWALNV